MATKRKETENLREPAFEKVVYSLNREELVPFGSDFVFRGNKIIQKTSDKKYVVACILSRFTPGSKENVCGFSLTQSHKRELDSGVLAWVALVCGPNDILRIDWKEVSDVWLPIVHYYPKSKGGEWQINIDSGFELRAKPGKKGMNVKKHLLKPSTAPNPVG